MKLFVAFSRAYPAQSALVLGAMVLASLFEGLGLTTLLPLLTSRVADAGAGGVDGHRRHGDAGARRSSASRRPSACCCRSSSSA